MRTARPEPLALAEALPEVVVGDVRGQETGGGLAKPTRSPSRSKTAFGTMKGKDAMVVVVPMVGSTETTIVDVA